MFTVHTIKVSKNKYTGPHYFLYLNYNRKIKTLDIKKRVYFFFFFFSYFSLIIDIINKEYVCDQKYDSFHVNINGKNNAYTAVQSKTKEIFIFVSKE